MLTGTLVSDREWFILPIPLTLSFHKRNICSLPTGLNFLFVAVAECFPIHSSTLTRSLTPFKITYLLLLRPSLLARGYPTLDLFPKYLGLRRVNQTIVPIVSSLVQLPIISTQSTFHLYGLMTILIYTPSGTIFYISVMTIQIAFYVVPFSIRVRVLSRLLFSPPILIYCASSCESLKAYRVHHRRWSDVHFD